MATIAYWQNGLPFDSSGNLCVSLGGAPASYTLAQWGLPIILPGGGTMAANGALTLTVALGATFTSCYMYFPAGAVAAGSTAGLFYVVMSSTTVGLVKNVTGIAQGTPSYTSGAPAIPAATTAIVDAGPGAYAQTVGSFVNLITYAIPANALGTNGSFVFELHASRVSNAGAIALNATFGGTNVGTETQASVGVVLLRRSVQNIGSASRQAVYNTASSTPTDLVNANTTESFPALDTTTAQNLIIQGELITSATDWLAIYGVNIQVNYAA